MAAVFGTSPGEPICQEARDIVGGLILRREEEFVPRMWWSRGERLNQRREDFSALAVPLRRRLGGVRPRPRTAPDCGARWRMASMERSVSLFGLPKSTSLNCFSFRAWSLHRRSRRLFRRRRERVEARDLSWSAVPVNRRAASPSENGENGKDVGGLLRREVRTIGALVWGRWPRRLRIRGCGGMRGFDGRGKRP